MTKQAEISPHEEILTLPEPELVVPEVHFGVRAVLSGIGHSLREKGLSEDSERIITSQTTPP